MSAISVDLLSADVPLRELIAFMIDRRMTHAEIPWGEHFSVHIALMFDKADSAKLVEHLCQATQESMANAEARRKKGG